MLDFFIGLIIGAAIGAFTMALISVTPDDEDCINRNRDGGNSNEYESD